MNNPTLRIHPIDLDKKLEVGRNETSIDRLSAAMIFPSIPNDQIEYLRDLALPRFSSPAGSTYSSFPSRIVDGVNNGIVAGSCLMYFRFLEQLTENAQIKTKAGNPLEASQRVAFFLCNKHNLGRDRKSDEDSDYHTVTTPSARTIWKDYQQVSHLWAAYIHLKLNGDPCCIKRQGRKLICIGAPASPKLRVDDHPAECEDHVLESVDVSVLLFLARQYERFAKNFFNGKKTGKSTREVISPFRVRYCDWNEDDVLVMEIPELEHISNWAAKALENYVPDE